MFKMSLIGRFANFGHLLCPAADVWPSGASFAFAFASDWDWDWDWDWDSDSDSTSESAGSAQASHSRSRSHSHCEPSGQQVAGVAEQRCRVSYFFVFPRRSATCCPLDADQRRRMI